MQERIHAGAFASILLCVLLLWPAQASATHVSCGDVITQDTKLDSDLVNCPASGIVIGADDIDLDLAGHVIDGNPGSSGVDNSGSYDRLSVKNGTVQQFEFGIYVYEAVDVTVSKVTATDTFSHGFLFVRSPRCVVEKSTGARNRGGSINLLESESCLVQKNSLFETFEDRTSGILLFKTNHSTVSKNSAVGAFRAGIELGTANDNLIEKNYASESTSGIFVFDSDRNTVRANDMNANLGDGLLVTFSSEGTVVDHNLANGNGDDGIDIETTPSTLVGNRTNQNSDLGIEAAPGTTDGGGNKASGNGNSVQCLNVRCK